jgi:hypothetical protein
VQPGGDARRAQVDVVQQVLGLDVERRHQRLAHLLGQLHRREAEVERELDVHQVGGRERRLEDAPRWPAEGDAVLAHGPDRQLEPGQQDLARRRLAGGQHRDLVPAAQGLDEADAGDRATGDAVFVCIRDERDPHHDLHRHPATAAAIRPTGRRALAEAIGVRPPGLVAGIRKPGKCPELPPRLQVGGRRGDRPRTGRPSPALP